MRWASFTDETGSERVGVLAENDVLALEAGLRLIDLLGDAGERLAEEGERALADPTNVFAMSDVRLLAPIPRPPSVRDFYAFEQHVRTARQRRGLEMDPDWYELPVFYFSNPAAIGGPNDDVAVPQAPAHEAAGPLERDDGAGDDALNTAEVKRPREGQPKPFRPPVIERFACGRKTRKSSNLST